MPDPQLPNTTPSEDPFMSAWYRYMYRSRGGQKVLIGDDPLLPPGGAYFSGASAPTTGSYAPPAPKPKPLIWKDKYDLPGYSQDWWKGLVANKSNDYTNYIMSASAMLPFMSPEDQRAFMQNISRQMIFDKGKGDKYGDTTGLGFAPPAPVTSETRTNFLSSQRAEAALAALERMRVASGFQAKKLGPGYEYLRQVVDTLRDFSVSGRPMSRAEYNSFLGAIDPLLNEAKSGKLAPYGAIAKAFAQPFFTGGALMNASQGQGGQTRYGAPNPKLYG